MILRVAPVLTTTNIEVKIMAPVALNPKRSLKDAFEVVESYRATHDAAEKLRKRALQSGFEGAFPVLEVKK